MSDKSRKHMFYSLVFLLTSFYAINSFAQENSINKEVSGILSILEKANKLTSSGKGTIKYDLIVPDYVLKIESAKPKGERFVYPMNYRIEAEFSDNKFRHDLYDLNLNDSEPMEKYAFNGEKIERTFMQLASGQKIVSQFIDTNKNFVFGRDCFPRINIETADMLKSVLSDSLYGAKASFIEKVKEESFNGYSCKVIRAAQNSSLKIYTFWLAKDLMYLPVKMEYRSAGADSPVFETIVEYKKYPDNIYFPTSVRTMNYEKDENGKFNLHSTHQRIFNDDWKLNIPIPDSDFENIFPKGSEAFDSRTDKLFTVE